MKNKKPFLLLILLIITGIFITGCATGRTVPEEDVSLEIAYDDEMGKVLLNDEKVESGEELIFEHGSTVNLQAVAIGGSRFLEWSNSGESQTAVDLVLEEDKALVARFLVPLKAAINCNHEVLDDFDLNDYINFDKLVVEVIDENDTVISSREKPLDEDILDTYTLGLNIDESNEYDVNVRLLGRKNNSSSEKSKTIYQGSISGVEVDLTAEPEEDVLKNVQVPADPNTAESLTVKFSSPDDALEYLESVEIKHVSEQETRQAVREYTGSYEQGEVVFSDGESYNGQELELFPGNWELTLNFVPEDIESETEIIRLLPSEEKVKEISLQSEMFEGDLDIGLIWDLPPSAPEKVTAKANGNSIEITWNSVDDADSYNIVRREPDGRDYWTPIGEIEDDGTEGLSYIDNDVIAGVTYRYGVVAVDENGLTSDYGESNLVEMPSK